VLPRELTQRRCWRCSSAATGARPSANATGPAANPKNGSRRAPTSSSIVCDRFDVAPTTSTPATTATRSVAARSLTWLISPGTSGVGRQVARRQNEEDAALQRSASQEFSSKRQAAGIACQIAEAGGGHDGLHQPHRWVLLFIRAEKPRQSYRRGARCRIGRASEKGDDAGSIPAFLLVAHPWRSAHRPGRLILRRAGVAVRL
jgi:hypothetical protein